MDEFQLRTKAELFPDLSETEESRSKKEDFDAILAYLAGLTGLPSFIHFFFSFLVKNPLRSQMKTLILLVLKN